MKSTRLLPIAVALAAFSGCVSASKYQALEAQSQSNAQALSDAKNKLEDLSKKLGEATGQLAKAASERDSLKKSNDELSAELAAQLKRAMDTLTQTKVFLEKRIEELQAKASKWGLSEAAVAEKTAPSKPAETAPAKPAEPTQPKQP